MRTRMGTWRMAPHAVSVHGIHAVAQFPCMARVSLLALTAALLPACAPLAGEMSTGVAWGLVLALACAGMAIVTANFGPLISRLYVFGLFLGTVYSIPPFR